MADPVQYYFNAVGHKNIVFSAREIDDSASVTIDSTTHLSANLNLHANRARDGDFANKITFSMVQGMGFVTARYYGLTPVIGSGDFIRQIIVYDENNRPSGCQKFHILLNDNTKWLLYAYPEQGSPNLELASHGGGEGYVSLVSPNRFTGFIQLAKLLTGHDEATFDYAAGAFPTTATMSATVSGISGAYSLNFKPYGTNKANELLMFALPHHYQSFDANTREGVTPLYMRSPTKGMMKGYLRSNWTMVEPNLPVSLSWLPGTMSNAVQQAVANMAANELNDISADKNQMGREITLSGGSMYFSGKLLAKYGNVCFPWAKIEEYLY